MRISTNTFYDLGIGGIQQQSTALLKTQQQVSTGRRMVTPADDPVAAARALDVSQSLALGRQFDANLDSAMGSLGMEEAILTSVTTLIQDVRTTAVSAGNAALNSSDRAALATELRGRYQELLGLANSTDGNGQYLFAGYHSTTVPFVETAPGTVEYRGDQGQRLMQIGPSRQVAVGDSGAEAFMRIKNADGTSQSLFTTLNNLIVALETPAGGSTQLTGSLNAAMANLDSALDNVLTLRASLGARMREAEAMKGTNEALALQYQQTLSQLQDVDYNKAISDLSRQKMELEAAQKSYLQVAGLSLFEYL